uniref:S41 family peptidase n=1 Tax=Ornithobacterium rhinotracheale TaxID=28251 RepID=UPI0039A64DBE
MKKWLKIFNTILIILSMIMFFAIGIQVGKKYDIAVDENDDYVAISYNLNEQKVRRLMSLIDNYYIDSLNTDDLVDKTIDFVTQNLDPHSIYIPKQQGESSTLAMEGFYEDVGLNFIKFNDSVVITHSAPNSPNAKLFKLSDRILEINQHIISTENQDSIKSYLAGKPNTQIPIKLLRNGNEIEVLAKRTKIAQSSVPLSYMINERLGYIKLEKFIANSAEDFKKALHDLKQKGMKSLIIDLRDNPGGLVDAAQKIADEFLRENQLIVYTQDKEGKKKFRYASGNGSFQNRPLYILINENSASASEILAGAIQDQDAGTIIGRRSYGKGLVQKEISLGDGSKIRLTTAKYYTPTGRCIQKPYTQNDKNYVYDIRNRLVSGELYNIDSIKKSKLQQFKTPKGKIVYGGGGIIPDIFIPIDTIRIGKWFYEHGLNQHLEQPIFSFIDKNHLTFSQIKEPHFVKYYNVDSLANALRKSLAPSQYNAEDNENFNTFVKASMANFIYGKKAYHQIWNLADPMILEAIKLDNALL